MSQSTTAQETDISKFGDTWAANIDFQHQECRVCWHGDWRKFPDLGSFPEVPGATVTHIRHSPEVDELWAKSEVLCYGANSCIRLLSDHHGFPVCEVATNESQRRFIADEFEILRDLGSKGVPAVRAYPEPRDNGEGILGFRMEKLLGNGLNTPLDKDEVIKCLEKIYETGIVHCAFHAGNIMVNGEGRVVAIDFGRSGCVRSMMAKEKRPPWWRADTYSFEVDLD
ncbi:hypothetical protein C8A03DRAFT_19829 [Achaetomium macrosporum]|uniref:ABC1 atypical kinase-like domain-containing protein n=1 Tax=Achaetomium macrosporum TaxID=79813 RepID=A0AAN7C0R8_9PEZI|nr:hypothetical protein C8A03DRAFT_19829 [Achaetomium macrosporum]